MRIAIAVFEGAEELDFVGPWEVLAAWRFLYPDDVEGVMVGDSTALVTCAKGMRGVPETSWDELGDNGAVITAAGVSAGIDMALHLVGRLGSPDKAREVRRYIQYDPQPPY